MEKYIIWKQPSEQIWETPSFFVWQGASSFLKRGLDSSVLPLFKKDEQRSPNGKNQRILVTIPLYNHAPEVGMVVRGIFAHNIADVLIVDDGSTDNADAVLTALQGEFPSLAILRHGRNQGKGRAILSAASWAAERGYTHIITIDADGQHNPDDLALFFKAIAADPASIIVGARNFNTANVPNSSRFGRSFSGFWMFVQTGKRISDMQSGYRAYPVAALRALSLGESRYSFEIEVLVRAAWAGFGIREVDVAVFYPPAEKRVSHFDKWGDNVLISLLNTRLTIRALIPLPFSEYEAGATKVSLAAPLQSLRNLLATRSTPFNLALSTFISVVVCCLPIFGLQSVILLFLIWHYGLNRPWTLAVSHLLWPPFVPGLCIEAGYYLRHGHFLTDISIRTLGYEIWQRLWEWLLGALVFGPVLAAIAATAVYAATLLLPREGRANGSISQL